MAQSMPLMLNVAGSGESYSLHGEETNVMNTAVIDIFVEHSCLQIIVLFVAQLVILN